MDACLSGEAKVFLTDQESILIEARYFLGSGFIRMAKANIKVLLAETVHPLFQSRWYYDGDITHTVGSSLRSIR
jgi:hypothetical protein